MVIRPEGGVETEVTYITDFYGAAILGVATLHTSIQIAVSKGGRSIRVWNDKGQRLEVVEE